MYLFGRFAGAGQALRLSLLESEYFAPAAVHAGALGEGAGQYTERAQRKIPIAIFVGTSGQLFPLPMVRAYVSPAVLAVLHVGLGDDEGAIASLERAYAARDLQLQYLGAVHHYGSLRPDPRFQDLVRRVGLQP